MADGRKASMARKTLNERGNKLAYQAIRRELLRAVYSPVAAARTDGLVLAQSFQRVISTRPIYAGWWAITKSAPFGRMRLGISGIW